MCIMRTTLPPPPDCPKIMTLPGSPPKRSMLSRTHCERHHQIRRAGIARIRVLRTVGRQVERAENVQPVIHADDHDVAELAEAAAVVGVRLHRGAVREPAAVHPDHDGLLRRRREVLGPDVQVLAVLVRDPVAMRKHELVGADRRLLRSRADRAPDLGVLDAFPRRDRLGQPEPLRFRVADAEERRRLALPEAAELSAFDLDHRRSQVGTRGRRGGRGRRCGFSCAKALPATPATAPPIKAVVVPSIVRRFMRPNGSRDSFVMAIPSCGFCRRTALRHHSRISGGVVSRWRLLILSSRPKC